MKVSIITITYNCCESLQKTIDSVNMQAYEDIEYIIIDGASTDGTIEVIKKNESNISFWKSEPDKGISDAFNKGIAVATGELIFFLNAGDEFLNPDVVSNAVDEWNRNQVDVLFYKVHVTNGKSIPGDSFKDNALKIWEACQVPHQGAFVRMSVFDKVGTFDLFYKIRMDYDFWARCKKADCSFKYIPRVIVRYESDGTSMQIRNVKRFEREGMCIRRKYGIQNTTMDVIMLVMPIWIRKLYRIIVKDGKK